MNPETIQAIGLYIVIPICVTLLAAHIFDFIAKRTTC